MHWRLMRADRSPTEVGYKPCLVSNESSATLLRVDAVCRRSSSRHPVVAPCASRRSWCVHPRPAIVTAACCARSFTYRRPSRIVAPFTSNTCGVRLRNTTTRVPVASPKAFSASCRSDGRTSAGTSRIRTRSSVPVPARNLLMPLARLLLASVCAAGSPWGIPACVMSSGVPRCALDLACGAQGAGRLHRP